MRAKKAAKTAWKSRYVVDREQAITATLEDFSQS